MAVLLLSLLFLWSPHAAGAQPNVNTNASATISDSGSVECSSGKALECLQEEHRICYQEECGACALDYVELPGISSEEGEEVGVVCVGVEDLELGLYDRVFEPTYFHNQSSESLRLSALLSAARFVAEHNRQVPPPSYLLGINEYSADTPSEARRLGGYTAPTDGTLVLAYLVAMQLDTANQGGDIPPRIDWVQEGAVTSVKNQGRCGGCWSISVAGAIEGAAAITSDLHYLQSVSFQQLISCDKTNAGCEGGFPASALLYANTRGTATLNDYPFTDGEKGQTTTQCHIQQHPIAVDSNHGQAVTYYGAVGDDDYQTRMQKMKQGVARQPVAIAVKSECKTFKNYKRGVLTEDKDCSCSPYDIEGCLDHAILLVGYDDQPEDGSPPYWKVKNSWGTGWGEDGYARIAQLNPHPFPNSWGLFGILAEGVVPLQAFNQTAEVYDQPQDVGLKTWERVLVFVALFLVAAILGVSLAIAKQKYCEPEPQPQPVSQIAT